LRRRFHGCNVGASTAQRAINAWQVAVRKLQDGLHFVI
jgi:hypothetical protein